MPESYRYGNAPPDSHPTPNPFQPPQAFGWVEGSGAVTSNPRGGSWVRFGDNSVVGQRLFTDKKFTSGQQNGRKR
jgi:hypothetical protein